MKKSGRTMGGDDRQDMAVRRADLEARIAAIVASSDPPEIKAKLDAFHASLGRKGYDRVWKLRREAIQSVLAEGEDRLSRAVAKTCRNEERRRSMSFDAKTWSIFDHETDLPWRPAAAAFRSAVYEAVLDQVRPGTAAIIETGSGWGEHLCNVFTEGGPIDATYYALELEEEGRKCARILAALEPAFRLEAAFFDYKEPDYSMVRRGEHTILLTVQSIEQVKEIHPDTISKALDLSPHVSGVHFEPIGWQLRPRSEWSKITEAHYARCVEMNYNHNLWPILQDLESKGRLRITKAVPNFIGLDHNPETFILWEKT